MPSFAFIAQRRAWIVLAYGVLAVFFCWPIFDAPRSLGILDWDQHLFYYASVLRNAIDYGQMPYWNPWYCGGNVLWQNPQVPLLSPAFLLTPLLSLPAAMKVNIVLHYWVGLVGMHLLVADGLGLRFLPAAAFLSIVVAFCGGMAMHLAVGHSVFLPCLYLPLQLYFVVRALRGGRVADMAMAAALLALMIYNGALHVVPMSVGALALLGLSATILRRDWRPLAVVSAVVALGFAYAAPKLWPVVDWVSSPSFTDVRTVLERPDAMSADMVLHTYLDRYQTRGLRFAGQRSGWYEYGNYIGGLASLLLVAAMVWPVLAGQMKERWLGLSLALTAAVLLLLSAGEFSAVAPASIANHLPLFSSFRIPSRYTIVFVLFGAAGAAWMLTHAGLNQAGGPVRALIATLCLLAAADVVWQNRQQLAGSWGGRALAADERFRPGAGASELVLDGESNAYGPDSPMLRSLMRGHTFYNCYESLQLRRVASPDEPLLAVSGGARLSDVTFSPNRVEFSVAGGPVMSEVSMNQNYSDGWRSTAGPVIPSLDKRRPAVRLAAGVSGRFAFTFRPPGLIPGLVVLAVAVGPTIAAWRRRLPGPALGELAIEG